MDLPVIKIQMVWDCILCIFLHRPTKRLGRKLVDAMEMSSGRTHLAKSTSPLRAAGKRCLFKEQGRPGCKVGDIGKDLLAVLTAV